MDKASVSAWLIHSHWNLSPFLPSRFPEPPAPTCFSVQRVSPVRSYCCSSSGCRGVCREQWAQQRLV